MQQKTDMESCKIEELQAILLGATPNELMALKRTEVLKTWTNMIGFNFKNYGGNSRSEVFHRYLGVDWMLSKIFKVEEIENLSKEEKSYLWSPLLKIEQSTLQHNVFQAQNKIESILESPKDCTTEDMEWALDQITKLRIFVERYDHFLVSTQGILSNALKNCQKNH
jgi:hypothetical protein